MFTKKLQIGELSLPNNLLLAPMAGYTDYCFRHLAIKLGVGLTFTELVSAKGLVYGTNGTSGLLYSGDDVDKTAVQIFGHEPYYMRSACESDFLAPFKIVDINMGCPVPKVFKNGDGSFLLSNIHKAQAIVSECVKSGKTVTVKIRTGLKQGDDVACDFAKMAEDAGAKAITIHGRVREAYYSGPVDYDAIKRAKLAVKIPVIANGGIFTEEDAKLMIENTGADGVMLARGAFQDPFLISRLTKTKCELTLKEFVLTHFNSMLARYGDKKATVEFRKFVSGYLKGRVGVKDLKLALQTADCADTVISLLQKEF